MGKKGKLAFGAVLAAGAGYLMGLLTAPKSGRETRKDIQNTAQKAKSEAEHKLKLAHSELSHLADEASKIAKNSKAKANAELKAALKQAETVRQKARELLSAVHEGEAEDRDLQKALNDAKKSISHLKNYLGKKTSTK